MALRLLIARHGNTFEQGEKILRVGKHTDLPLSNSGRIQAKNLGDYIKQHCSNSQISQVLVSQLRRTHETASIALTQLKLKLNMQMQILDFLDEIDYGPDEGQPETDVIKRIGSDALQRWETQHIVPPGWLVDTEEIIDGWQQLANKLLAQYHNIINYGKLNQHKLSQAQLKQLKLDKPNQDHAIFIVTSNGVARFAPSILAAANNKHQISKMKTGALSSFVHDGTSWQLEYWNQITT